MSVFIHYYIDICSYYHAFYKQGLITAEQLEKLIAMQNSPKETQAA